MCSGLHAQPVMGRRQGGQPECCFKQGGGCCLAACQCAEALPGRVACSVPNIRVVLGNFVGPSSPSSRTFQTTVTSIISASALVWPTSSLTRTTRSPGGSQDVRRWGRTTPSCRLCVSRPRLLDVLCLSSSLLDVLCLSTNLSLLDILCLSMPVPRP